MFYEMSVMSKCENIYPKKGNLVQCINRFLPIVSSTFWKKLQKDPGPPDVVCNRTPIKCLFFQFSHSWGISFPHAWIFQIRKYILVFAHNVKMTFIGTRVFAWYTGVLLAKIFRVILNLFFAVDACNSNLWECWVVRWGPNDHLIPQIIRPNVLDH